MRAIAWLAIIVALGCQSSVKRRSVRPEPAKARHLTLDATTAPVVEVATADELKRALRENSRPVARLVEVVEVTWRDRTFDRAVLGDMIAGNYEYETRTRFKARFGLEYDEAFRVVLHGYAAQLAERFGIVPREMSIAEERGRWLVTVWGALDGEQIEWKSGAFSSRGPVPSLGGTPLPKSIETVLVSERGGQYELGEHGATANFKPRGDEPASDRMHRGDVMRTYLETVEYLDANGRRFRYPVPIGRRVPYFSVRPGGLAPLKQSLHVVRIDFDQTAQPGSAALIESLTVLDGKPGLAELGPAYTQLWQRVHVDRLAALAKLAPQTADVDAALVKRAHAWAGTQVPSGPLQTEKRAYDQTLPNHQWDAATKTLTIRFHHKHTTIVFNKIAYPNPELQTFSCPAGAPCAVPPNEAYHTLEQRYDVVLVATYRIDRDARLSDVELDGPRIEIGR